MPPIASFALVRLSLNCRPESGRWVAECLAEKSRAVLQRSPKLVILAGSNALFGFSARRLSEQYGVESVNLAVHAGLGLDYILHYGRRFFAPGRVFVLPLEYELYGKAGFWSAYRDYVMGYDGDYFLNLPLARQFELSTKYSTADRLNLIKTMLHLDRRIETGDYQSRTLNAWGDETHNEISERTPAMLYAAGRKRPDRYSIDAGAWGAIVAFASEARAAGSQVVLAYPNIYAKAIDFRMNEEFFGDLKERAAAAGITIIGNPRDSVFGIGRCYNTEYHQNSFGQAVSTDRLFRDLADSLGSDEMAQLSVPRGLPRR